jgi:hypothetical protein
MKKRILILLLLLLRTLNCVTQEIPAIIQRELNVLKAEANLKLDSCRTNDTLGYWHTAYLGSYLEYPINYKAKADSLNLKLSWQMVYDNTMIERIIQLLDNGYRKDELETLVNKQIMKYNKNSFEKNAVWAMKVDTSKIFKQIKDSLDKHRNKDIHPNPYHNFEVFMYLKLDTTVRFHFVIDSITKAKSENIKNYYLDRYSFDYISLINVCRNINDKRLINPLIDLMGKSIKRIHKLSALLENGNEKPEKKYILENEQLEQNNIIRTVRYALIKMKVDPYYSEYLKSMTYTLEEIKQEKYVDVYSYVELILSQESFRELSKYLHSEAYTDITSEGPVGKAYETACLLIMRYIENEDLHQIVNNPKFNLETDRFKIYEWMQENYGKYKIKRIW